VLVVLVAGIDVDGDQREIDRRPLAQLVKDLQQCPTVLPAGQTDHHPIAVFNEVEVFDGLGGLFWRFALRGDCDNPSLRV
jgi:hypothetical protein